MGRGIDESLMSHGWCRDHAKVSAEAEASAGAVKQAQDVVPPMERLVKGLEQQQADTIKSALLSLPFPLCVACTTLHHVLLVKCVDILTACAHADSATA